MTTTAGGEATTGDRRAEFASDGNASNPYAFLQWKGTDVCMDFHCECGAHCHFDGYFAYSVKCPHCDTVWEMPIFLYPRKADKETSEYDRQNAKLLEADEDFEDAAPGTPR